MAHAWVVNGAPTQKRQQEMDWVRNDRCSQDGYEGYGSQKQKECEAHKTFIFELPRVIRKHQQQGKEVSQ